MTWLASIAIVILLSFFVFEVLINTDLIEDELDAHPQLASMFEWLINKFLSLSVVVIVFSFFAFWVIVVRYVLFGR